MEVIPLDKNEKVPLKNKSNNTDVSQKPIVFDQAPEPRGKYGAQIDTDLDNY